MAPSASSLLDQLNEPQREAVTHEEGPLLILAGAGSGKTRTLTYRVAHLIATHACGPDQILAVTFTNKAAEEMRSRVLSLLPPMDRVPLVCTFHSFGVRVLRRYASRVGYRNDFNICDADDQHRLYKGIYKEMDLNDKEIRIAEARSVISRAKNKGWGPDQLAKDGHRSDCEVLARLYRRYQQVLRQSNAVDFDDLILLTVHLLQENEDVCYRYGEWYRHLLIDEYQDTNFPQYELIKALTCTHDNLCAVGDEDQSIYGFRGAEIDNILRFEKDFPGTRLIKLEQNYRSTQLILDAAGAVVSNNQQRKGKTLWTERKSGPKIDLYVAANASDEARWVAEKIEACRRRGVERIAVLYRTNFLSRQFEEALRQRRIPYRLIGGVSFYSRKEIKDALAYLRMARNPDDNVSLLRVINEPSRGIGNKTLEQLQSLASEHDGSLWKALEAGLGDQRFPGRAHRCLNAFREIIGKSAEALEKPLPSALERILSVSGYVRALESEGTPEADSRLENLKELINVAREVEAADLDVQQFLDEAALRADTDEYDARAPVTLMTLHNAKGLEFETVFLAGCEEGLFPHARSLAENDIEEERRLCYVGMTRAERKLHLSYSRRRRFYGSDANEFNQPSQFLHEIPGELVESHRSPLLGYASPYETGYQGAASPSSSGRLFPRAASPSERSKPKAAFSGMTLNTKQDVQGYLDKMHKQKGSGKALRRGAFVEHAKWGRGKVLSVEPSKGDDLKVTVRFSQGIKKLMQSYAKLRVL
ncbi:MAG TPA: UvrD-helicase domain-containing protein [Acidobacteriota bacterium]|nr:UvrD-helicase domain-containing protein [Acidobacteriota bacterium]